MAIDNRKQQLIDKLLNTSNFSASNEQVKSVITKLAINPIYPIILIGGTNGKGSTCAYLSTILSSAGYKVGVYTSPHVFDYNERIKINNEQVSDNILAVALETVISAANCNLGIFKAFTLASHIIFQDQNIDIAIVEVGLGGAKDTTNLFTPTISAITTVALDHCDKLGYTCEEIGLEKAQIFRSQHPAFFGNTNIPDSVIEYALKINANLHVAGTDFHPSIRGNCWDFISKAGNYYGLPLPNLRGKEQLNNAALAIAILDELKAKCPVSLAQIKSGLLKTQLIGRFQVMPGFPQIIFDTAHNPQAVKVMTQNMVQLPFAKNNYALLGIANDKDWRQILTISAKSFSNWVLAPLNNGRSSDISELKAELLKLGIAENKITLFSDLDTAFRTSFKQLNTEDRLVCFGSFIVIEACYKAYQEVK